MITNAPANEVWMPPLPSAVEGGLESPRVAIAGISIESSTFSPHVSDDSAFTVRTGADLIAYYPFLDAGTALSDAARWVPIAHGRALPGGVVASETYERMKRQIVEGLRHCGPLDGLFLDVHGAMSVDGIDDAEADLVDAIREVLGRDVLISASMDLHGNVSQRFCDAIDLVTCYRMAPHEDWLNTKERAVHNLLARLRGPQGTDVSARRPWKAWVPVPVLLPGEKTSTRVEPAKSLYDAVPLVEALPDVLDASIWVGYAWADEPRCMASVVVTGDNPSVVRREAERLGQRFWDAREDFQFVGPAMSLDEAIELAVSPHAARPFFISDSGDNPTAGGTGDVSWTLGEVLENSQLREAGCVTVVASVFDPEAVEQAVAAGLGATVTLSVGGRIDSGPSGPVSITGDVHAICDSDPVAGVQVAIRSGSVYAIVTTRRKPFHLLDDFRQLDIDPERADIVVVKIGYLEPELHSIAKSWVLALTPGGVDQDLFRLGHRRLQPGVYPFSSGDITPSVSAIVSRGGLEDPHVEF